ncbi:MAG TPA: LLM class flavin-dependent oxidoreductase [Nannocystis sp.]
MPRVPLSLLDLAFVGTNETVRESLEGSVRLAQRAEALGYLRVWYAEHHNIESIASSATAVLIAHVAAHTRTIRVGAGGVMLPNHAPLTIAEQFGTLATLHPGRVDLGLGRAPGTDAHTLRALRRDPSAADNFPQDVLELQGYLRGEPPIPHVHAIPGRGTNVPLYILGSSLFGAELAARLGLPYAFASHFAPQMLHEAVGLYRARFEPSQQLERAYVIAAVNVIAADSTEEALAQRERRRRAVVRSLFGRPGRRLEEADVDAILDSPYAAQFDQMFTYTALGTGAAVRAYLERFQAEVGADELMVVHQADTVAGRLRSLEIVAEAWGLSPTGAAGAPHEGEELPPGL